MTQRFTRAALALLVLPLALSSGCYYLSAQERINEAERALEDLRELGAPDSNPYHFHAAEQYLIRARRENRNSDFASAREFADKSLAHYRRSSP